MAIADESEILTFSPAWHRRIKTAVKSVERAARNNNQGQDEDFNISSADGGVWIRITGDPDTGNRYPGVIVYNEDVTAPDTDLLVVKAEDKNKTKSLTTDKYYRGFFRGVTSSGDYLYEVITSPQPIFKSWLIDNSSPVGGVITVPTSSPFNVELSTKAWWYDGASFIADAFEVPSTGLWEFSGHITGYIAYTGLPSNFGQPGMHLAAWHNGTNAQVVFPYLNAGVTSWICDCSRREEAIGTGSFSIQLQVTNANANALKLYVGYTLGAGTVNFARILNTSGGGNSGISTTTSSYVTARKIGF